MIKPTVHKEKMKFSNRTPFEIGEHGDDTYYNRNKHDYPDFVHSKAPFSARYGPTNDSKVDNRRAYAKRGQLFQLLETKDAQEKVAVENIITAIKYMYRMKPSVDFRVINEMYLRLIYDFFTQTATKQDYLPFPIFVEFASKTFKIIDFRESKLC